MKFPKTVAAVKTAETTDQWAIADALVTEIGPMSLPGIRDGSEARAKACAKELKVQGFEYEPAYLIKMRDAADTFTARERHRAVSFTAHMSAGSPEMLKRIIKRAKGTPLTQKIVKETRKAILEAERQAAKKEKERLQRIADEKQAKADAAADEAEAERLQAAADEAAKNAKKAPERGTPTEKEIDLRVVIHDLGTLAQEAVVGAENALKKFNKHLDDFDEDTYGSLLDEFLMAANAWNALAGGKQTKGGTLSLVAQG